MNKCKCENCNCNKMENKVLNQLYKIINQLNLQIHTNENEWFIHKENIFLLSCYSF